MKPSRLILIGALLTLACLGNAQQNLSSSENASLRPGEPIHVVEPKYPKKARKQKIEGTVTLHVTVAADGSVKEVSVLKGDPLLTGAAIDSVRQWRFQPFVTDGGPVEGQRDVTIKFALAQDPTPVVFACDPSVGTVYKVDDSGVSPPKVVDSRNPEYSEAARHSKLQGTVTLSLNVGPDGHTCDIRVTRSLDRELDKRALRQSALGGLNRL